ncbi:MAG: hypothetical protein ACUVXA_12420 [Candidatus Jordarchaeum sp.]|uniref:hypothetical protein n=1 Tax=Candidatus Jordarchaeum sp. TaxID=2823881 RepID=UPI00404B0B16
MKELLEQRLEDRKALVNRSDSGIGKAISVLYAKEGAYIIVNEINLKGANKIAEMIKKLGRNAMVIKGCFM